VVRSLLLVQLFLVRTVYRRLAETVSLAVSRLYSLNTVLSANDQTYSSRRALSPVHTSNNVEATLSIATSRTILSTKSKVASTLLPFGNSIELVFREFRLFGKVETSST